VMNSMSGMGGSRSGARPAASSRRYQLRRLTDGDTSCRGRVTSYTMTVIMANASLQLPPKVNDEFRREVWLLLCNFYYDWVRTLTASRSQEFGLTLQQAAMLRNVTPGEPVPMNALANLLGCDPSNITGLVDRLETRKLVKRRQNHADRRLKMIELTKAGVELRAKAMARIFEEPGPSFGSLTQGELKQLCDVLQRLMEREREVASATAQRLDPEATVRPRPGARVEFVKRRQRGANSK
jgi:DNA-binding MarR family transcriptional regulator